MMLIWFDDLQTCDQSGKLCLNNSTSGKKKEKENRKDEEEKFA